MRETGRPPATAAESAASRAERLPARVAVRPMTETDLTAVLTIEKASFGMPWTLATFTGLLRRRNTRLWVAEVADEVVGYAAVWMVADQAELGDIAVADAWRRRGIATRLLEAAIEEMRTSRIRELFLEVRESNVGAQRLYDRHGFHRVGRRTGYYTKPREDALVLRLLLEPDPGDGAGADPGDGAGADPGADPSR